MRDASIAKVASSRNLVLLVRHDLIDPRRWTSAARLRQRRAGRIRTAVDDLLALLVEQQHGGRLALQRLLHLR